MADTHTHTHRHFGKMNLNAQTKTPKGAISIAKLNLAIDLYTSRKKKIDTKGRFNGSAVNFIIFNELNHENIEKYMQLFLAHRPFLMLFSDYHLCTSAD